MSSSVLGLGAASLGGVAMSLAGKGMRMAGDRPKNKKEKMVKTQLPSLEDYRLGQGQIRSFTTEPVLGAGGQWLYGKAPSKVPQGMTIARGPDLGVPQRDRNRGSYTTQLETYQLVPAVGLGTTQLPMGPIGTKEGKSEKYFSRADYRAAREQGYSNREILQYLNKNEDKLRGKHAAGGGGLYDELSQKIQNKVKKDKKNKKNK
jgi:hypothetical protein